MACGKAVQFFNYARLSYHSARGKQNRGFALIGLALFIVGQWQHEVPTEAVDVLSNIKVKYTKHASMQALVVSNLVESAVNSRVNRSIEDPVFLASELCRTSLGTASGVKATLAAYKQPVLATLALHIDQATHEQPRPIATTLVTTLSACHMPMSSQLHRGIRSGLCH